MEELGWFKVVDTTGLSGGGGRSVGPLINLLIRNVMLQTRNSPATVMVRGSSRELSPAHSTINPSTIEATDSEVRVAVTIPPLESVRTPRNAGLPSVSSVLLALKPILNTFPWPCGGVMSHRMKIPGREQVKVIVSSGQATVGLDVRVAAKSVCSSEYTMYNCITCSKKKQLDADNSNCLYLHFIGARSIAIIIESLIHK